FDSSDGTWHVRLSNGTSFTADQTWDNFATDSGWTQQLFGDFNGDGKTDIANFYGAAAQWWVSLSTGTHFVTTLWDDFATDPGWTAAVVGDFNGDGKDDVASFYGPEAQWWVSL